MNYITEMNKAISSEIHYDDFLCHHGIKGQKWGIRRFQYEDGSLTPEGKERYGYGKSKKASGMSEETKNTLAAIALPAATILATKVFAEISRHLDEGYKEGQKKVKEIEKVRKNEKIDKKTGLYLKNKDDTRKDEEVVNPWYTDPNNGGRVNCTLCTTAYDLRKRGYDVYARETRTGKSPAETAARYKNANLVTNLKSLKTDSRLKFSDIPAMFKPMEDDTYNKLKRGLLKQGNNARGNLFLYFTTGGGHSVSYEIEKNKVVITDAQSGERYTNLEKFYRDLPPLSNTYAYFRTDNLEIDWDKMKKAIK